MDVGHLPLPLCHLVDQFTAVVVAVDVAPAVAVADPEKLLTVFGKEEVVIDACKKVENIDPPYLRLLLHDQPPFATLDIIEPELEVVMAPVRIDPRQLRAVRGRVDPWDVAVFHVVIDPALIPALHIRHADPDGGILLTHLRSGDVGILRILPLIVGRDEPFNIPLITLPIDDMSAVRGP